MRQIMDVFYLIMANWLIVASVGRVLLQLQGSVPLDALPFIGFVLGLTALSIWFAEPLHNRRHNRNTTND